MPGTHNVEGGDQLQQVVLDLQGQLWHLHRPMCIHTYTNNKVKINKLLNDT